MADLRSDLVAQFIAFTGVEDTSKAMQMLDATNDDIQAAVELYFAAHADVPGAGLNHGSADVADDARVAQALQDAQEEVRAPIPTKVDRLVGSPDDDARERRRRRQQRQQEVAHMPIMDAFRARREEDMMVASGMTGFPGQASGGGTTRNPTNRRNAPVDAHWADQFEPPQTLVFQDGDCEDAAMAAREAKKWLVVNIQSPSSFDSHRLNRDTWKDAAMQAMLPVSFILYQTYDVSEEGQELAGGWGITEFPVIIVVDPVTGAPMKKWHGFVRADELIEELVPYMDTSFDDPEAANLFRKRPPGRGADTSLPPQAHTESMAPADTMETTETMEPMESERSYPMASVLERAPSSVPTSMGPLVESPTRDAQTALASGNAVAVEKIRQDAGAMLPEEPPNEEKPCRIALRLPDGTRAQRKFPQSTPLRMIETWCISLSDDAARGRRFKVVEAVPGAAQIDLDASDMTIGAAGIAGVMLGMKWVEHDD